MGLAFLIVALMVVLFFGALVAGSAFGVPGVVKEPPAPKVAPALAAAGSARPGQLQQEAFAREAARAVATRGLTPPSDPDDSPGMQIKVMAGVFAAALTVLALGAYVFWEPYREAYAADRQLTENVNRGAILFTANCAKCHGPTGAGLIGPSLHLADFTARHQLNPNDPADLQKLRDLATTTITHGRFGTVMPIWGLDDGGPLNETQISNLVDLIATNGWAVVVSVPGAAAAAPPAGTTPGATPAPGAAPAPAAGGADPALALIAKYGCAACHTIASVPGAVGTIGPDLSKQGSKPKVPTSTGALDNNAANLGKWIFNAPSIKPGIAMPNFSGAGMTQDEANTIAAYLETLK
jgi:mono/diheme cytochrome c family protein